jgi:uncharacterized hydrophobic protein (TIGR00341 family)
MALRLMEILLPRATEGLAELLKEQPVLSVTQSRTDSGPAVYRVLLEAEKAEPILDLLDQRYGGLDDFRVILLPVEATLPRPPAPEGQAAEAGPEEVNQEEEAAKARARISREELYQDIAESAQVTKVYLAAVALSSLVAAIGIVRGNLAVIIGAMVIAPLLGPNMALSLGTTLADFGLVRRSLRANVIGVAVAFAGSVLLGLLVTVDPALPEIASRTRVGLSDIALALASGASGALAFTTGISTALIGVMVAVALLPPLVTCGLLVGAGHFPEASGAFLLLATNVICVNLSGVVTFLFQGVHPGSWWEADRARRATRMAIGLWIALLLVLVLLVLWMRPGPELWGQ